MKKLFFIFSLSIMLYTATEAQTVDYEAAGKLTGGLLVSAIGNRQSKLEANSQMYQEEDRASGELVSKTMEENTKLAYDNDEKQFSLDKITKVAEYVANEMKIRYYEAVGRVNVGVLSTYARKSDINQISTTGNYILFEGKRGKTYDYRLLQLENYVLPDEFFVPICNLTDKSLTRNPLVVKAFGFLADCDKCKSLLVNTSVTGKVFPQSFDCDPKTSNRNVDSALYYMRLFIKNPQLSSNIDQLDYYSVRMWYNMLKMQNAKKTSDLLELIAANGDYYHTMVSDPGWSSRTGSLRDNSVDGKKEWKMSSSGKEAMYSITSTDIADYYFYRALLSYYEIKKTNGTPIVRIASNLEDANEMIADINKILSPAKK